MGNRGSDVRALQYLLRAAGRVSDPSTASSALRRRPRSWQHQKARGLPATGVVNDPTWRSLTPNLSMGSSGDAVRALQRLLNDKRRAGLTVSGTYGTGTRDAVAAFQRHMTSTLVRVDGRVHLAAAALAFRAPRLGQHERAVRLQRRQRAGELGNRRGDRSAAHRREAHLRRRPRPGGGRRHRASSTAATSPATRRTSRASTSTFARCATPRTSARTRRTIAQTAYDRAATRALIKEIRAAAPGHVKVIYFNDPVLIGEGLTTRLSGHDDHLPRPLLRGVAPADRVSLPGCVRHSQSVRAAAMTRPSG